MIYKGILAKAILLILLFPRHPTFESFYDTECIQLVQTIFQNDFDTYKQQKNIHTNFSLLSLLNKKIPHIRYLFNISII